MGSLLERELMYKLRNVVVDTYDITSRQIQRNSSRSSRIPDDLWRHQDWIDALNRDINEVYSDL